MEKSRICNLGSNLPDGENLCVGDSEETIDCSSDCPKWANWEIWGQCSQTCFSEGSQGKKTRSRGCMNGEIDDLSGACPQSDSEETQECGDSVCETIEIVPKTWKM